MNQPDHQPSVLFVCVHNAGPSQMGAACATYLSGGAVEVRSQGPRRPNRWGGGGPVEADQTCRAEQVSRQRVDSAIQIVSYEPHSLHVFDPALRGFVGRPIPSVRRLLANHPAGRRSP